MATVRPIVTRVNSTSYNLAQFIYKNVIHVTLTDHYNVKNSLEY